MRAEPNKRPRRVPFTPEEVANIIAVKQRRELIKLKKFKKSTGYKIQNSLNIACFFIYWEIIFCFFGPAQFQRHYSKDSVTKFGDRYDLSGKPVVSEIDFIGVDDVTYTFVIDDFVKVPEKFSSFLIGKDYLLGKNLKGRYFNNSTNYRLFAASPMMILILLALFASSLAYLYNLNQNAYSLMSITVLNSMCLFGIIAI